MKIFKIIKSEISKHNSRIATTFFILLFAIVIAVSAVTYSPTGTTDQFRYTGETVNALYTNFKTNPNSNRDSLLEELENQKNLLINFSTEKSDYQELNNLIEDFKSYADNVLGQAIRNVDMNLYNAKLAFETFKEKSKNLYKYFSNLETKFFLITTESKNELEHYFYSIDLLIPSNLTAGTDTHTATDLRNIYNTISTEFLYNFSNVQSLISKIKIPVINKNQIDEIIKSCYDPAIKKLNSLDDGMGKGMIADFVIKNPQSSDEKDMNAFHDLLLNYKLTAEMASISLRQGFDILNLKDFSESQIQTFYGYEDYKIYDTKESQSKNKFILSSELYPLDFIETFSFNGGQKNAYDFTYFVMQILTFLVIVYSIYLLSVSFAGEESSGTIRLMISRPYSRNKIFLGKFISVFTLATFALLIGTIISFIIGLILFGLPAGSMLFSINASLAFATSPIIGLILAFISSIIMLMFFLAITNLLSTSTKSSMFTMLLSIVFFVLSIVLGSVFSSSLWIKFLPFAHFELFKFFGAASQIYPIYTDASLLLSGLYALGFILILNLISITIFKKKDL